MMENQSFCERFKKNWSWIFELILLLFIKWKFHFTSGQTSSPNSFWSVASFPDMGLLMRFHTHAHHLFFIWFTLNSSGSFESLLWQFSTCFALFFRFPAKFSFCESKLILNESEMDEILGGFFLGGGNPSIFRVI